MTRTFTLIALGFSALAMAGAASADTVKAKFEYNPAISVEANYDAFHRIAAKACAIDVRSAGGVAEKRTIQADCSARLMNDAMTATGRADLAELHKMRTGAQTQIVATAQ